MFWGGARVEFLCAREDEGVIARPMPARAALPDWYKKLPAVDQPSVSTANSALTIKRCMPFLDAMTLGFVLPVAATVRLDVSENGAHIDAGWDFDKTMVSFHAQAQIAGHPYQPRAPAKLHNYWTIRTPKGWSCLFVPLINRAHPAIEIVSGVVDTDNYPALIHFPFFFTGGDGRYVLEKGLPMVQVIPFKRAAMELLVRAEAETEKDARTRTLRATQAGDGWYRLKARAER